MWEPMARYCLTQHGLGVCGWGEAETGQGQSLRSPTVSPVLLHQQSGEAVTVFPAISN